MTEKINKLLKEADYSENSYVVIVELLDEFGHNELKEKIAKEAVKRYPELSKRFNIKTVSQQIIDIIRSCSCETTEELLEVLNDWDLLEDFKNLIEKYENKILLSKNNHNTL